MQVGQHQYGLSLQIKLHHMKCVHVLLEAKLQEELMVECLLNKLN
jgi:hypothetical protein